MNFQSHSSPVRAPRRPPVVYTNDKGVFFVADAASDRTTLGPGRRPTPALPAGIPREVPFMLPFSQWYRKPARYHALHSRHQYPCIWNLL